MIRGIVLFVLGIAVGWVSHTPVAALWVRWVKGKIRVIQHRGPNRSRAETTRVDVPPIAGDGE